MAEVPEILQSTLAHFYESTGSFIEKLHPFESLICLLQHPELPRVKENKKQTMVIRINLCTGKQTWTIALDENQCLRKIQRKVANIVYRMNMMGWKLTRVFLGIFYNPFRIYPKPLQQTLNTMLTTSLDEEEALGDSFHLTKRMEHVWIAIYFPNHRRVGSRSYS